jgi:hypothetical protein
MFVESYNILRFWPMAVAVAMVILKFTGVRYAEYPATTLKPIRDTPPSGGKYW